MAQWLKQGKVTPYETRLDGLKLWPTAFRSLFVDTESKYGKVVVMVTADDFVDEKIVVAAE